MNCDSLSVSLLSPSIDLLHSSCLPSSLLSSFLRLSLLPALLFVEIITRAVFAAVATPTGLLPAMPPSTSLADDCEFCHGNPEYTDSCLGLAHYPNACQAHRPGWDRHNPLHFCCVCIMDTCRRNGCTRQCPPPPALIRQVAVTCTCTIGLVTQPTRLADCPVHRGTVTRTSTSP
jgi:hypothetical protein